jgi:hypothetical protein
VLQWAVMPRLRAGGDHAAATFGAGLSGGNYASVGITDECNWYCGYQPQPVQYTIWANAEAGFEYWRGPGSHFAYRAFLGVAHGFAGGAGSPATEVSPLTIPYTGMGFGWSF